MKRWIGIAAALVALGLLAMVVGTQRRPSPASSGPSLQELLAPSIAPTAVVGDLGGMPVTIPRHFGGHIEYDGDPGLGERRDGSVPRRTHSSAIRGFGFDIRYPDMAGLSSSELKMDYRRRSIYTSDWIYVTVVSGSTFHGPINFEAVAASHTHGQHPRYEPQAEREHGLQVFRPRADEVRQDSPAYKDTYDHFVARKETGQATAVIRCSNVGHEAAPCTHSFHLEPRSRASVTLSYRRGLLPQWQSMQTAVGALILGFQVDVPTR